jgi:chromosome segregation ATPase
MKTVAVITLILLAAVFGVRHYSSVPHKSAPPHAPVSSPAAPSQVEEVAYSPPPNVTPPPAPKETATQQPSFDNEELNARIRDLKEKMRELNQSREETMVNAQNYQASLQQQNAAAANDLERQIQNANTNIVELQNQLNNVRTAATVDVAGQATQSQRLETEIANQKTRLAQLRSQQRQINDSARAASAAGNQELVIETDQMRVQRADLEHQLRELEAQRVSNR